MPRKQSHSKYQAHRLRANQNKLDALHLNTERMKLVRLVYTASSGFIANEPIRNLRNASGILMEKVRESFDEL